METRNNATGAGLIRPPPDKGSKYIIPWDDLRGHHPMEGAREKKKGNLKEICDGIEKAYTQGSS